MSTFLVFITSIQSLLIVPSLIKYSGQKRVLFQKLPADGTLYVYTINGKKLFESKIDSSGSNFSWNLKTSSGDILSSGVYYVVTKSVNGNIETAKFVVVQ